MIDMIQDIKKSPEYIETNERLIKLHNKFDKDTETYDNGAINGETYLDRVWNIHLSLNTLYCRHQSIIRLVPTLHAKYSRLNNEVIETLRVITGNVDSPLNI